MRNRSPIDWTTMTLGVVGKILLPALLLAGCAAGPDVTLLGSVGIEDGHPSAGGEGKARPVQVASARRAGTPAYGAAAGPMPIDGSAGARPVAFAEPASGGVPAEDVLLPRPGDGLANQPRLKTEQEVADQEAELRRLAGQAEARRPGGLWGSTASVLEQLRSTHGEAAIEKIEAEGAE